MSTADIITAIATELFPDGPNCSATRVRVRNNTVSSETECLSGDRLFLFSQTDGIVSLKEIEPMSAEQFCAFVGFSPVRLLTLLDCEAKISQSGQTSPKLADVRAWINALTIQYAATPIPSLCWQNPPYTFEETLQEVMEVLNGQHH